MTTRDDMKDLSDLRREEIAAFAEHEHVDGYNATLPGECLMHVPHDAKKEQEMLCDDIRHALHAGDLPQARTLFAVPRRFLSEHPEAVRGVR